MQQIQINQSMKVAILGAEGNLGSQLVRILANNYRLLLWDRKDFDILDYVELIGRVKEHKPDIIINCVAYNAVDKCEEDEDEFKIAKKLNGELVGVLSNLAIEHKALLVHFVSDYVFDGEKEQGYKEDDKTKAISKYGESKIIGEQEILKRVSEGLKYYLIRTSKLFGPKGPSESAKESFFDLILRLSKDKKEFKMIDGEEMSCFTYTLDLAKEVKKLIENENPYGIYHIVNEGRSSWYDGAKYLLELMRVKDVKLTPSKSKDYSRPAKRPKYSVLINTKLPKLRTWKEALKEYLDARNL